MPTVRCYSSGTELGSEPSSTYSSSDQPSDDIVKEPIEISKCDGISSASKSEGKDGPSSDEVRLAVICQRFDEMSTENNVPPEEHIANQNEGLIENKVPTIIVEKSSETPMSVCSRSDDKSACNSNECCDLDEQCRNSICSPPIITVSSPDKLQNDSCATIDQICSEEYSASESGNCYSSSFATSVSDIDESYDDTESNRSGCENSYANHEASEESVFVNRTEEGDLSWTTSSSSSSEVLEDGGEEGNREHISREVSSSNPDISCTSGSFCECDDCCESDNVRCPGCGRSISVSASEVTNESSICSISSSSSVENVRHTSLASISGFEDHWPGAGSETATATSDVESSTEDSAIIVCNCCDCFNDCLASDGQSDTSVSLVDVGTSTDDVIQQRNTSVAENSTSPVNYVAYVNMFVIVRII